MEIKNKEFRNAMAKAGLSYIHLEKGNGYFYIWDNGWVCTMIRETVIYLNSFNQQPVQRWIDDIKELLKNQW